MDAENALRGWGQKVSDGEFKAFALDYSERLKRAIDLIPIDAVETLSVWLLDAWRDGRQVFLFGNGGSAGNAIHLANDYLYGISRDFGQALRVQALPANSAVVTCLANDEGYEQIFVRQLAVLANPGDIAIAFSGSGNSPNILRALEWCQGADVKSAALLGYSGGKAKSLAQLSIHVPVDDMQISEDLQLVVGHMLMQRLYAHRDQARR